MSTSSFPAVGSLSNSKFETYKLAPLESDVHSTVHALAGAPITQSRVHGKTLLSVREVQSRIKHDHLGRGWGAWFVFVDEEWAVWAVKLDQSFQPVYASLGSIPTPIPSANSPPAEYPSVWALSPTTYLLSDGHGRLYPLSVQPSADTLTVTHTGPAHELVVPSSEDLLPFKVEWVGGDGHVLVSCVHRERDAQTGGWGKEKGWDVKLCRISDDWTDTQSSGHTKQLELLWTVKGEDAPLYAHFSEGRFLLGSSGSYSLPPSATVDASATPPPPTARPQAAFTWAQTSTTVTLTFALPKSTPPKSIRPTLGAKALAIVVDGSPLAGFSSRSWWDAIKPSESTWTWDATDGHLTVEVEKSNDKTRWTQLFQTSEFEPVEETLSIEESAAIRDNLAKFTSSFEGGGGGAGGLGVLQDKGGISSLMREEMDIDEEEDGEGEAASARREVRWTWIQGRDGNETGALLCGEDKVEARRVKGGEVVIGEEMGWGGKAFGQDKKLPEILVKSTLDALLFRPPSSADDIAACPFQHIKTFPALSYVISSKREVKYILHTPTSHGSSTAPASVLVFSSPTTSASQGDLFVYYEAGGKPTARSGVVKLGGGDEEGALLGVKGVEVAGERVLVGLCERRIVVIRGLL